VIVLALNGGSSSIKIGLYGVEPLQVEELLVQSTSDPGASDAMARFASAMAAARLPAPDAVGHRLVHGGPALRSHCLIDASVVRQLQAATGFAPLHMPQSLAIIRLAQERFPGVAQVACFDTAFHAGLPDVARVLPIARRFENEGIQRYGFHGLSCESIVHALSGALPRRLVIAHLGNGSSVTAVSNGKSIDTSMGLTPTGGVIMGTRSGDLDPGVLVHLLREKKLDAEALGDLVDRRSGLLGISGLSSDMRKLHEAAATNADARLAIAMFCLSVRKQVAAMAAVLGGVDAIAFTGGIGENDAEVRAAICGDLSWMGSPAVLVLPSREDEQIARHVPAVLGRS
jgi:acetate kinase